MKLKCLGCLQIKKGETFVSETDTEVIPKLCKWVYHSLSDRVPFSEVRQPVPAREKADDGQRQHEVQSSIRPDISSEAWDEIRVSFGFVYSW